MSDRAGVPTLRTIADYQFGRGAGTALFPEGESFGVQRFRSGRPQQVTADDGRRLVSVGLDGRLTLGLAGGRRLAPALDAPTARVVVGDESEPFVRDGKNVFAKFVSDVDSEVRARDEVVVVHERAGDVPADDDVLGVGRAELDADAMHDFETGMAVMIRTGADEVGGDESDGDGR